jgi:hypothetical protein
VTPTKKISNLSASFESEEGFRAFYNKKKTN